MNCKFIWNNLPKQIKDKLDITLKFNWNRTPTEINEVLRQFEAENNSVYLQYFKPKYKTNWFFLIRDLNKLCQAFDGGDTPEVEILERFATGLLEERGCPLFDEFFVYRLGDIVYSDEGLTTLYSGTFYYYSQAETTTETYENGVLISTTSRQCA